MQYTTKDGKLTAAGQSLALQFEKFVYWKAHRVARRCPHLDTDDIAQEAWLALGEAIASVERRTGGAEESHVMNTTSKVLEIRVRRNLLGRPSANIEQPELIPAREKRPLSTKKRNTARWRLRLLSKMLTPRQAQAIDLRFNRNLKLREVAEELDIPERAAISRVELAVRRLRKIVGGYRKIKLEVA